ncbi:hypothetical protein [Paracidobacterium acidisoli]|uniref:Uncharacterized protein n=1 Tax=Paracidobacterium acidisoli TaxID=2303751 RepID=A0A372IQ74_9BACT|nr:hypothetical protein [Paracidobacterium acidisoli]MBT9331223.1 hypothetical protein [Paracidobacterium acidisoli]
MSFCLNKHLTPLQRRSIRLMGAALLLVVLTNFTDGKLPNPLVDLFPALAHLSPHPGQSAFLIGLISALSAIPVLFAVFVVGRYLSAEPDEFVRALVIRALLWSFAFTMAGNAVADALMQIYSRTFPLTILDGDIFFISFALSLRLMLRTYR